MDYPPEFSGKARGAVAEELIWAERWHRERKQHWKSDGPFDELQSLKGCILDTFRVYARETVELRRLGVWTTDQVRAGAQEGLRLITIEFTSQTHFSYLVQWGYLDGDLQREFRESAEWRQFEDDLLTVVPFPQIAKGVIAELPAFSEPTKRKLALQWEDLREEKRLTDDDLSGYERKRQRAAAEWRGLLSKQHYDQKLKNLSKMVNSIGLEPSIRTAEGRFRAIDCEYWLEWSPSGAPYEVYAAWLDSLKRDTLAEVRSVWKERSYLSHCWFERVCGPAISKALTVLIKGRIAQARKAEIGRQDRNAWAEKLERLKEGGLPKTNQAGAAERSGDETPHMETGPAKACKTAFGRNIDRFRKECGWSFDELATKTGLDKKLTLGHVNEGKGAHPSTFKVYADAFTRKLNRTVTVAELERAEGKD